MPCGMWYRYIKGTTPNKTQLNAMAPKVKSNQDFLRKIYKGSAKTRKAAIKSANSGQIKALCECAVNACSGRLRIQPSLRKKLKNKEGSLIRIAYARDPLE